ncbi:MAG: glyceraldehyde 3-phosphate dehydrogenase [Elusimicrobia bacterium]|nr:MAG: glyceraldehyde 3-phosphate dehydrogenase [Elusimicrobiota bacterium]
MAIKVGINGFGRIGRLVARAAFQRKQTDFEIVAVNDLTDAATLAHLFKYDSTFGQYQGTVEAQGNDLVIDGKRVKVVAEKEPAKLPWKALGVELVIESTGRFTDADKAKGHIEAGATKVIISAPAKGEDITVCMGINNDKYDPAKHNIISNASCTTNALAPLVTVLNKAFKVKYGIMTTIHSYTNDQVVLDFAHKDLRRARAAGVSMIPSSTGAAKAIGLVVPELKGKLTGVSIRVPTPDVSLVDFSVVVEKATTKEQGNPSSSIFDATMTDVMEGTLVKVFGWYDNEWGYSNRVVDLAAFIGKKMPVRA